MEYHCRDIFTLRVMMSSLLAHFRHLDMFAMFMPAQAQGVARLPLG